MKSRIARRPANQASSELATRRPEAQALNEPSVTYRDIATIPFQDLYELFNAKMRKIFDDSPSCLKEGIEVTLTKMIHA